MAAILLSLSIALQLAAAVLALCLARLTRKRWGWGLVAAALLLMVVRRCVPLYRLLSGEPGYEPELAFEIVGLAISACVLAGIAAIGPMWGLLQRKRAEEELQEAHDQLEARVVLRTVELAKANAELVRAKDAAEAASRAKSAFLANMSHEIRTPLSAVIGMTELVLKGPLESQQREFLGAVRESGETLLQLVDDILNIATIEAGTLALQHAPFDFHESLADTLKGFEASARQKGLELAWRIDPAVPRLLRGDDGRIRQVLAKLLGNALKFTERGAVRLEVSREAAGASRVGLHFCVSDTGIGVPAEKREAIFEAFEQGDGSMRRRHGGSGLGLAIAARLAAMMGGRIWVESEAGRGSRFHFTVALDPAVAISPPPAAPRAAPRCRGLRVLLAEDSLVNQKLVVALLEEEGCRVTVVGNGRDAVQLARTQPPDLILMDVQMPEMDGLEAAGAIRACEQSGGRRVPIIALTAHALSGDRQRCLAAGMDGYLAKPLRAEELFELVEQLCRPAIGAAPDAEEGKAAVDLAAARAAVGGSDEALRNLADAALREFPELLAALRAAVEAGDAAALRRAAHTLKASLSYFNAQRALTPTLRLEAMGQNRQLEGAAQRIAELETEIIRIGAALEELVRSRSRGADP